MKKITFILLSCFLVLSALGESIDLKPAKDLKNLDTSLELKKFVFEDLTGIDFSNMDLERIRFSSTPLTGSSFKEANLTGAILWKTDLRHVNFEGANLKEAVLWENDLRYVNFEGANLTGADLSKTDLRYVNFEGANLTGANLHKSNLQGVDLKDAILQETDLRGANLKGTDLTGVTLEKESLNMAKYSKNTKGLTKEQKLIIDQSYQHASWKTIGMQTKEPLMSQSISHTAPQIKTMIPQEDTKIFYLPQAHGLDEEDPRNPLVRLSQFQIARSILSYINSGLKFVIFYEGIKGTSLWEGLKNNDFISQTKIEEIKNAFPDGIPLVYEDLTEKQKILLFEWGAIYILYSLGELNNIYPVISDEDYSLFSKNRSVFSRLYWTNNDYWTHEFRELKLKEEVNIFLKENPNYDGKIIIVYGAGHKLEKTFQNYSFERGFSLYEQFDTLSHKRLTKEYLSLFLYDKCSGLFRKKPSVFDLK